jgi:hypothetical protein
VTDAQRTSLLARARLRAGVRPRALALAAGTVRALRAEIKSS